jgi:hypothetical protein
MLQGHPQGFQNPLLVVIVCCWGTLSTDSQSGSSRRREMRSWERSCLQHSLDRIPGLTLQGYLCFVGFVGTELRCGRYPLGRLVHPDSLGTCLSTVLQRLLSVSTIRRLLETVCQDLDQNVSLMIQRTRTYTHLPSRLR